MISKEAISITASTSSSNCTGKIIIFLGDPSPVPERMFI